MTRTLNDDPHDDEARLRDRLERAEEALLHARCVAHEVHNALHLCLLGAENLELSSRAEADFLLAGLRRAVSLSQDLKNLTLDEQQPCKPRSVLEDVAALVRLAYGSEITLETSLDDTPPVRLSASELQQVALNLLLNAVRASPSGAVIQMELRAGDAEAFARLVIRDRGHGISDEVMEILFQPGTRSGYGSSGLGLYIARRVLLRLGGELKVLETGPQGTAMVALLPLVQDEAPSG